MSFRSGAAVAGGAVAVAGAAVTLAVVLGGHTAAVTSGLSPDAAAHLATPASSAPAPATSAASSGTPRSGRSTGPRAVTGSYSQTPSPRSASARPQPSAPTPAPSSAHATTWQPRPAKWTPGDPRRPSPPDWGWPG
jgi:hypothetical protein